MVNQKQVDLLKSSVEQWNVWRKEHQEEKIDLSEAARREVTEVIVA